MFTLLALAAADPAADTAALKRISQEILDSIPSGSVDLYDRYFDPEIIHVDENNVVRDKAAYLAQLHALSPGITGSSEVQDFRAIFAGPDIAFTTYRDQETVNVYGSLLHTRFRVSDTWRRTSAGWRIVGETVAAELRDPPSIALPGARPCGYAGRYRAMPGIEQTLVCTGDHLVATRAGRPATTWRAEAPDLFFTPGAPRSRRVFLRDAAGRLIGFADRREGEDVVWRRLP